MSDPLAEVVGLLQPRAAFSKIVSAAGPWRVQRSEPGRPFYCVVLQGSCCLHVVGHDSITLEASDFVLIPSAFAFTMSSVDAHGQQMREGSPTALPNGEFRFGPETDPSDVRFLVGYCVFDSPDAVLLVSLLPKLLHIRGEHRLAILVELLADEAHRNRPARDVILRRLLEVLLIEALRSTSGRQTHQGLLRGLADDRIAVALRSMHADPTVKWTVAQLAKQSALSRSAFFDRFLRQVGVTPMEYLLAWRMAIARSLLASKTIPVAQVAERVGYSSPSTFSVAFTRYVGVAPTRFSQNHAEASESGVASVLN